MRSRISSIALLLVSGCGASPIAPRAIEHVRADHAECVSDSGETGAVVAALREDARVLVQTIAGRAALPFPPRVRHSPVAGCEVATVVGIVVLDEGPHDASIAACWLAGGPSARACSSDDPFQQPTDAPLAMTIVIAEPGLRSYYQVEWIDGAWIARQTGLIQA